MLGLTAQQMGELIGVTSSQARKYEEGVNRIAAGRLYNIAQALGIDVGYFFEGMHSGDEAFKTTPQQRMLLELARNFISIPTRKHQEGIVSLAAALSMIDEPPISTRERGGGLAALREVLSEFDELTHEQADSGQMVTLTAPVKFIRKLMEIWALTESETARLLGFESKADVRDLISGAKQFSTRDVKDRVRELLRIRESLHGLFRDIDAEREWLREARPEPGFDSRSALAWLLEGSMANLLMVSQFVQRMVGR